MTKQSIPNHLKTRLTDRPDVVVLQQSGATSWVDVAPDGTITLGPDGGHGWLAYNERDELVDIQTLVKPFRGPYTRAQREQYQSPPCPKCGAPSDVNWVEVSTMRDLARHEPVFLPSLRECSARCWENDPSFRTVVLES